MSKKQKRIFWPTLLIALVACGALVLVAARATTITKPRPDAASVMTAKAVQQSARQSHRPRNLSLQPEAFNLARRLGQRFSSTARDQSVVAGTLTVGTERRVLSVTRKRFEDGEQVQIALAGTLGPLTWNSQEGAMSSGAGAIGSDRELIERLVLDSPDQFVLAQLRGASYQIVARQARPSEAGGLDTYKGPVWDVIRIAEPGNLGQRLPQSPWRLYQINVSTGLIDKVVSEEAGQTIIAEITGWVTQGGETVPTHIAWKHGNQTVMEFSLTNLTFDPQ